MVEITNFDATPGPWIVAYNEDKSWVGVDCGNSTNPRAAEVCTVCTENVEFETEEEWWNRVLSDAHLIAAAPDLLKSLTAMRDHLVAHASLGLNEEEVSMLNAAEAAINRARGGK